ncbi:FAD-dependent monooxygenase [Pinirhizobacter sp.]|jgi:2-polyprenyl-6-methoxyphenol hydroxylase-like FAD-dependent oxidoreductase|uniref:FAD-dependent monooxygenase n=1 Tax=Pinirhizobacter sp. TaxID=2950432 RepID=UPI002F3FB233
MNDTQVLIAGAGPTGMALALWLARDGVRVRIVDPRMAAGEASRAMAVHARTLEFYDQLGLAQAVVAAGIEIDHLAVRVNGVQRARLAIGHGGEGISPFPFVLAYPQDDHERLLEKALLAAGVAIERGTQVLGLDQTPTSVNVRLDSAGGAERVDVDYLCGCDGAGSRVRHALGLDFAGGTYEQTFYVTDAMVEGAAADGGVSVCMNAEGFCLVLPVRRTGAYRLIGVVQDSQGRGEHFTFEDVRDEVERTTGLKVNEVNWFSTYRSHHRIASSFASGRVYLAGDAAHIHSPAGGQGMNTGIGDAINLAWKLASVLHRRADASILSTYATERMAFARELLQSTDRAFRLIASDGSIGRLWRTGLLPHVIRVVAAFSGTPRLAFRVVSQVRIAYRDSALSAGRAGTLRGGDRLPWLPAGDVDNFTSLTTRDWQLHVYGEPGPGVRRLAYNTGLPLHGYVHAAKAQAAGIPAGTVCLVRPDGYIAMVRGDQEEQGLVEMANYIARFAIVANPESMRIGES